MNSAFCALWLANPKVITKNYSPSSSWRDKQLKRENHMSRVTYLTIFWYIDKNRLHVILWFLCGIFIWNKNLTQCGWKWWIFTSPLCRLVNIQSLLFIPTLVNNCWLYQIDFHEEAQYVFIDSTTLHKVSCVLFLSLHLKANDVLIYQTVLCFLTKGLCSKLMQHHSFFRNLPPFDKHGCKW